MVLAEISNQWFYIGWLPVATTLLVSSLTLTLRTPGQTVCIHQLSINGSRIIAGG